MALYHSPSVFELIACDKLRNGLREALRYLLNNLKNIDYCKKLALPSTDETVFILDLIIEYNYLRTYKASYAENLYNLVRVSRSTGTQTQQILPSLACLTLVPYIGHKIKVYFESLNYKETRTGDELRRIRIYRLLTRSTSFLNLLCMIRSAAGRSSYHNCLDGLIGICLMGKLDGNLENPSLADRTSKSIADITGKVLTIGSYVIQFLDYWNTHSNSTTLFDSSLPIPEAPQKDDLAYTDERSSNICLICEHVRQNECALSNTGYVFCYGCLHKYVKSKQRCPITGQPATIDNIVKLFTIDPF